MWFLAKSPYCTFAHAQGFYEWLHLYQKDFFIVVVQAEVRIAVKNAVRMALCIECSPAVQEIQDSIPTETHRSRM